MTRRDERRWEWFRKKQCRSKKAHDNYLTALAHAVWVQSRTPDRPVGTYVCEQCGMIHVGHMSHDDQLYPERKRTLDIAPRTPRHCEICPRLCVRSYRCKLARLLKKLERRWGMGQN